MKLTFILLLGLLAEVQPLLAQNPPAQDADIVSLPAGGLVVRWSGHPGRTYFMQISSQAEPLARWTWAPFIESGSGVEISHEIAGTATRAFFRLQYTDADFPDDISLEDWDADGDGLSNLAEIQGTPQTNPLLADSSGDGIPDGWAVAHGFDPLDDIAAIPFQDSGVSNFQAFNAGVQASSQATLANRDGDVAQDPDDADPLDADVDWLPAAGGEYALIDVEVPADSGMPVDLNDDGDVLFERGIWEAGNWRAVVPDVLAGSYPVDGDDPQEYETRTDAWRSFNSDQDMIGSAVVTYTTGQLAGGDGFTSACSMLNGQSVRHLGDELPFRDYYGVGIRPLGIDDAGTTYARLNYFTEASVGSITNESRLAVFEADGTLKSITEARTDTFSLEVTGIPM